ALLSVSDNASCLLGCSRPLIFIEAIFKASETEQQICEVGIQTTESVVQNLENYVYLLQMQLNNKVNEIENLQKQLNYAYNYAVE
ncbi:7975_t:CDS:2, partial [Scutellospora calospora]